MYKVLDDESVTGWIRSAFLLPEGAYDTEMNKYRKLPSGLFKFSDTTLGGNKAVNPLPQFTGFADINEERYVIDDTSKYNFLEASSHMGRDYSERFDDGQVLMHMRFGVPTYNSMTSFFTSFYDPTAAQLANKGRSNQIARAIGRIIGTVATFRILPYILVGQLFKFMLDIPSTKYYYLKPTMHVYNDARSSILNTLLSNAGFIAGMDNTERPEQYERAENPQDPADWAKLLPDVYNSNGSVDIYKVTTRWQRLANMRYKKLAEALDINDKATKVAEVIADIYKQTGHPNDPVILESRDMDSYIDDYFSLDRYKLNDEVEVDDPEAAGKFSTEVETNIAKQPAETASSLFDAEDTSWVDRFLTSLDAEQKDGGQFVSVRIDKPSSTSFSATSSTKESGIAQTINSMSSGAKDLRFNLADGQLVGGGLGAFVGAVTSSVGALISGVAESIGVSGLAATMGNALVDIPKHWEETITNAPKINAKFECRAWSSDPLTRIQNLFIPAVTIMAGGLPRSTGHQSYTGPFICEYFVKGRGQSRLAIMDSFTMTLGAGNIGYTKENEPLGIDIEFSMIDLTSITHMPLTAGFKPLDTLIPGKLAKHLFSDQNQFTDLMAIMSSLDLVDQIYTTKRLKRNFHKASLDFQQWTSPARWAANTSSGGWLFGATPGRWLSAFADPTGRGG